MDKSEKFIIWCDKAMAGTFYALIYFLPISIALLEICTGTVFFFFLLKRGGVFYRFLKNLEQRSNNDISVFRKFCHAFKPPPNILNIPILMILLISLISVVMSQHIVTSIEGFVGKVLQSVFLYFNFIECMRSRKRLKIFMCVFFVSFTLICINGLYQSIVGHGFIHGHIVNDRILSSFRAANDFAGYLIVVIPILFCLAFFTSSQKRGEHEKTNEILCLNRYGFRIGCVILFLIGLFCLGFTYSRGGWIGFMFSLILMSLVGLKNYKIFTASSILIVFFLIIFYPGISFIKNMKIPFQGVRSSSQSDSSQISNSSPDEVVSDSTKPDEVVSDSTKPDEVVSDSTKEILRNRIGDRFYMINLETFLNQNNRLGYWRRSFKIIKDYPLFGCGLNTYALIEWRYKVGWGGYPHNSYLQMAAETGLIGISAFLWMLFVLFRDSLRMLRRVKIQNNKMLFVGVLTGLLGFLIHSFFDTNFYSVQLGSLMWLIFGLVVALQKIEQEQAFEGI